jgi:hypothetical protein
MQLMNREPGAQLSAGAMESGELESPEPNPRSFCRLRIAFAAADVQPRVDYGALARPRTHHDRIVRRAGKPAA